MRQPTWTGQHPVGAGLLTVVAAAALIATTSPGAAAADTAAPNTRVASSADAATVPTMIVLDASGSMRADDAPGPRIDAGKSAVTALIDSLPAQAQVGLQVYGTATGSGDDEKAAGCQDVVTLAEVGTHDPAELKAAVNGIEARGYTPIGTALRAAAAKLPLEGARSIVLVSDGEDTCAPPAACDVAKELDLAGTDLVVHSIGFKVDQAARDQLACIADATGGTYSDAGDAVSLDQVLTTTVDEAIADYTSAGIPVTGADQQTPDAPLLEPGQYVDTFATGETDTSAGTTKYYRVPTPVGGRVHVSATMIHPDLQDVGLNSLNNRLTLVDLDGDNCVSDNALGQPFTVDTDITVTTLSLLVDGEKDCTSRDALHLKVERTGKAWAAEPVTVEIAVRIEPPVEDPGPDVTEDHPDLPKPVFGSPQPVAGGRSFNDATLLSPGATYSDTLREGEARYYRVPVGWGQRLTYLLLDRGPVVGDVFVGNNIVVELYNPVREEIGAARDSAVAFNGERREITASTNSPVRYLNREEAVFNRALSLAGDYYLVVIGARHNGDEPPAGTTIELTTVLTGDVEAGPVYGALPGAPDSADASGASTSAVPTEVGTSSSGISSASIPPSVSTRPSADAVTSPSVDTSVENVATDNLAGRSAAEGSSTTVWWVVGGVVVVLLVGAGVMVARRHRSTVQH